MPIKQPISVRDSGPMMPSELLTAAADWIDSHGWIQGNFYEQGTLAACAIGALHFAAREVFDCADGQGRRAAIADATDALAVVALELNGKLVEGATTQEQVIVFNNSGVIDKADAICWLQKASAHAAEAGK